MRILERHPRLRWAVPVTTAAVIVGGVAIAPTVTAGSDTTPRTAAELLVDVQQPTTQSLAGTVATRADLGLPVLPRGMAPGAELGLLAGENTVRVWIADEQRQRLALLGRASETTLVRNGDRLWVWDSQSATAHTYDLSEHQEHEPRAGTGEPTAGLPSTPQEAAARALAAITPTTEVTTTATTVRVAGREGHELVLAPTDPDTLVARVTLVIDAETHVPLRVRVYSTQRSDPAIEVGFTAIDYATPDAGLFAFEPPPGATTIEHPAQGEDQPASSEPGAPSPPLVVGEGWSAIVIATIPATSPEQSDTAGEGEAPGLAAGGGARAALDLIDALPEESGAWGTGRVLRGTLFSAILTTDGRLAYGPVPPQALGAALVATQ